LPHEACFTEPEFDGIGRRTHRGVIRQRPWFHRERGYPVLSFAQAAEKDGAQGRLCWQESVHPG